MCGIAGIFNAKKKDRFNDIHSMTLRISHRGPDAWGYLVATPGEKAYFAYDSDVPSEKAKLYFGHRRLSIIDVEGAKQPLSNEDSSIWVVFNGEIYNYVELSELLKKKGHLFKTAGDTEVLLHLWEDYQEEMLHHLVGMFAFAIYDTRRDILFLARDRFGEKPLFYAERAGDFFFASELQSFFGLKDFRDIELNKIAIAQYFRYGFIAAPLTAYKEIYSLPAGHWISIVNGQKSLKQYWKPNVYGIEEPNLEKLKSLIYESVRIRMRSDVPIGAFLSGGIDSSLITSYMREQSIKPIKTFTVSSGVEYIEDESVIASQIAKILNTEHTEINVKPNFLAIADKLAQHYGQPFADHSAVMTYYVSKGAREHVKVALTGDGGDELFAGYTGYFKLKFYRFLGFLPFELKKYLAIFTSFLPFKFPRRDIADSISSAFSLPLKGENIASLYHKKWRDELFNEDFAKIIKESQEDDVERFSHFFKEASSNNLLDKWLEVDQRLYLADDILCKLDIASMANSLECRSPFLDHRLAEYVNSIKSSAKIANGQSKAILRRLAEEKFSNKISSLPKKGFSMPLSKWMRGELKNEIRERIFSNKKVWGEFLNEKLVEKMWDEFQSEKFDHSMRLWMIERLNILNLVLKNGCGNRCYECNK